MLKIDVAPLRDRVEDIPMLAGHFLAKYAQINNRPSMDIHPAALEMLLAHAWPGNVRELENVIQRALLLANGATIGPEDLPEEFQVPESMDLDLAAEAEGFEDRLRAYKIRLATEAIQDCKCNKTHAARRLHISRAYLHRLLRSGAKDDDVA